MSRADRTSSAQHGSRLARLGEELRRYATGSLYLWVCLAAIFAYKSAVLRESGMALVPMGTALVKALILGKFILIGEALGAGRRTRARTVLGRIAWRSAALTLVLMALTVVEEVVVAWAHHRDPSQALAELLAQPFELVASCILMLVILVPLVMVQEISRALGPGALRRVLLGPPGGG